LLRGGEPVTWLPQSSGDRPYTPGLFMVFTTKKIEKAGVEAVADCDADVSRLV
jgi:hypothetical protein